MLIDLLMPWLPRLPSLSCHFYLPNETIHHFLLISNALKYLDLVLTVRSNLSDQRLPQETSSEEPVSLVTDKRLAEFTAAAHPQPAGVVSWSPPQPNWNPWTACNIDEGPLATVGLLRYRRWDGGKLFGRFVWAGPCWSD